MSAIRNTTAETIIIEGNDWVIAVFMGLGLASYPPTHYVGGFIMAIGGAMLMWKIGGHRDRRKFWLVIGSAIFAAWLIAELHAPLSEWAFSRWWPEVEARPPVQFAMAIAGAGSKFMVGALYRFFHRIEKRSDDFADKILSGGKK